MQGHAAHLHHLLQLRACIGGMNSFQNLPFLAQLWTSLHEKPFAKSFSGQVVYSRFRRHREGKDRAATGVQGGHFLLLLWPSREHSVELGGYS